MANIGVIGAGTWGIALAVHLHKVGHKITVWSKVEAEIKMLQETHEHKMLPGVKLPEDMVFTLDEKVVTSGQDMLVMAVASSYTRATAKLISPLIKEGQIIINVAKGIEEGTLMTQSQITKDEIPQAQIAALSGPSHAEEVSRGIPTTIVVGAKKKSVAEYIQNQFMNENFRVYTSPDILGIELGGSLKNVVALAAGVADGLGYGDNTKAALITRGIAEIARLGVAMGAKFETFCGLTGIGDLIVTCASVHSRNRKAGYLMGQGKTMEEATKEVNQVVEGIYSAKAAMALAEKYQVQMPIIEKVCQLLFEGLPADVGVKELMLRDKKIEISDGDWEE